MDLFIYSSTKFSESRTNIEDDLDELLDGVAEVIGGGSGATGWNIDLEIFNDENTSAVIDKIKSLLIDCAVPADTYIETNGKKVHVFN